MEISQIFLQHENLFYEWLGFRCQLLLPTAVVQLLMNQYKLILLIVILNISKNNLILFSQKAL